MEGAASKEDAQLEDHLAQAGDDLTGAFAAVAPGAADGAAAAATACVLEAVETAADLGQKRCASADLAPRLVSCALSHLVGHAHATTDGVLGNDGPRVEEEADAPAVASTQNVASTLEGEVGVQGSSSRGDLCGVQSCYMDSVFSALGAEDGIDAMELACGKVLNASGSCASTAAARSVETGAPVSKEPFQAIFERVAKDPIPAIDTLLYRNPATCSLLCCQKLCLQRLENSAGTHRRLAALRGRSGRPPARGWGTGMQSPDEWYRAAQEVLSRMPKETCMRATKYLLGDVSNNTLYYQPRTRGGGGRAPLLVPEPRPMLAPAEVRRQQCCERHCCERSLSDEAITQMQQSYLRAGRSPRARQLALCSLARSLGLCAAAVQAVSACGRHIALRATGVWPIDQPHGLLGVRRIDPETSRLYQETERMLNMSAYTSATQQDVMRFYPEGTNGGTMRALCRKIRRETSAALSTIMRMLARVLKDRGISRLLKAQLTHNVCPTCGLQSFMLMYARKALMEAKRDKESKRIGHIEMVIEQMLAEQAEHLKSKRDIRGDIGDIVNLARAEAKRAQEEGCLALVSVVHSDDSSSREAMYHLTQTGVLAHAGFDEPSCGYYDVVAKSSRTFLYEYSLFKKDASMLNSELLALTAMAHRGQKALFIVRDCCVVGKCGAADAMLPFMVDILKAYDAVVELFLPTNDSKFLMDSIFGAQWAEHRKRANMSMDGLGLMYESIGEAGRHLVYMLDPTDSMCFSEMLSQLYTVPHDSRLDYASRDFHFIFRADEERVDKWPAGAIKELFKPRCAPEGVLKCYSSFEGEAVDVCMLRPSGGRVSLRDGVNLKLSTQAEAEVAVETQPEAELQTSPSLDLAAGAMEGAASVLPASVPGAPSDVNEGAPRRANATKPRLNASQVTKFGFNGWEYRDTLGEIRPSSTNPDEGTHSCGLVDTLYPRGYQGKLDARVAARCRVARRPSKGPRFAPLHFQNAWRGRADLASTEGLTPTFTAEERELLDTVGGVPLVPIEDLSSNPFAQRLAAAAVANRDPAKHCSIISLLIAMLNGREELTTPGASEEQLRAMDELHASRAADRAALKPGTRVLAINDLTSQLALAELSVRGLDVKEYDFQRLGALREEVKQRRMADKTPEDLVDRLEGAISEVLFHGRDVVVTTDELFTGVLSRTNMRDSAEAVAEVERTFARTVPPDSLACAWFNGQQPMDDDVDESEGDLMDLDAPSERAPDERSGLPRATFDRILTGMAAAGRVALLHRSQRVSHM